MTMQKRQHFFVIKKLVRNRMCNYCRKIIEKNTEAQVESRRGVNNGKVTIMTISIGEVYHTSCPKEKKYDTTKYNNKC